MFFFLSFSIYSFWTTMGSYGTEEKAYCIRIWIDGQHFTVLHGNLHRYSATVFQIEYLMN